MCKDVDEPDDVEGEGSNAEADEAAIEGVLGVSGVDSGLRVEVRSWTELWEQLKGDIVDAHKKRATLTMINQLLILHNSEGAHFAHCVHVLAHHYQALEQLPAQTAGGYQGCSIISNEHVQNTARNWLTNLSTGEVSLK